MQSPVSRRPPGGGHSVGFGCTGHAGRLNSCERHQRGVGLAGEPQTQAPSKGWWPGAWGRIPRLLGLAGVPQGGSLSLHPNSLHLVSLCLCSFLSQDLGAPQTLTLAEKVRSMDHSSQLSPAQAPHWALQVHNLHHAATAQCSYCCPTLQEEIRSGLTPRAATLCRHFPTCWRWLALVTLTLTSRLMRPGSSGGRSLLSADPWDGGWMCYRKRVWIQTPRGGSWSLHKK